MIFRKIILFLLISLSLVVNVQARMPTERPASTPASIFELPPFERAVCCIKFYEGMHRAKDYPYVGYGHKLRPGERYSANMSTYEAEQLLRKDLRELCAMFRSYGQDSLLLAALSYNIGPYKVTGYKGKYPKSSIRENGRHRIIDKVTVVLNEKNDEYQATFANLGLTGVPIGTDYVRKNPKLLSGNGVWCIVTIGYISGENVKVRWEIQTLKPIQISNIDLQEYIDQRKNFTTEE